jgi:hypothetical protein
MSLRDGSLGLLDVVRFDELQTLSQNNKSRRKDRQNGGKCIVEWMHIDYRLNIEIVRHSDVSCSF